MDAIFFGRATFESLRAPVFLAAFDFAGAFFRGGATCFLAVFTLLPLLTAARRAFRAGAFAGVARLTIGLGRADLALEARVLPDDFAADCREVDRRIPFAIGLLIVNPQDPRL